MGTFSSRLHLFGSARQTGLTLIFMGRFPPLCVGSDTAPHQLQLFFSFHFALAYTYGGTEENTTCLGDEADDRIERHARRGLEEYNMVSRFHEICVQAARSPASTEICHGTVTGGGKDKISKGCCYDESPLRIYHGRLRWSGRSKERGWSRDAKRKRMHGLICLYPSNYL